MSLNTLSAADLREMLAKAEAEERAALTQVGQEFFAQLVDSNKVVPSKSEDKDWFGFRVTGLTFKIGDTEFAASVLVTDVTQTEKAKAERKARQEAEKVQAEANKALEAVKSNPEKYAALQATLAKAGVKVA